MGARVEVREAETGDAEALARLFGQLGYPIEPELVARRLSEPGARVLVALERGTPVGMAGLAFVSSPVQGRWGRLTALVVAEDARARGSGRGSSGRRSGSRPPRAASRSRSRAAPTAPVRTASTAASPTRSGRRAS